MDYGSHGINDPMGDPSYRAPELYDPRDPMGSYGVSLFYAAILHRLRNLKYVEI